MIKFSDGMSSTSYLQIAQLDNYLRSISDQNDGYIIFGQKGNRKLSPNNSSDLSSLIKLNVIPKLDQSDYNIFLDNNSSNLYDSTTRQTIEGILQNKDLWFVYDMVGEEAPFQLNINNEFSNSIENLVNGTLSGPLHDLMGMLGNTDVANKIFNESAQYFKLNTTGSDLYSLLFLSKIKQIKIWQNGDLSFKIPIIITFHTLGENYTNEKDFVKNTIDNVIFPTYLLQLIQGYHRQPNLFKINSDSSWAKTLSKLIRVVIGPMNFKIQIGQFFSTDKYSPLQISNLNVKYGMFINGYPTQQIQDFQLININPIILEDTPPYGSDKPQPLNSNITFVASNNRFRTIK